MRRLIRFLFFLVGFILVIRCTYSTRAAEPFEIKDGDRVVLIGDALLERENTYGYLETRMHEQFPERNFTVRNISWAGDTPRGWSRASFDPAEKGMDRLREAIELTRPTVVFLGYGMAASLQEMTDRAQDPTLNPDPARYGREPMSAGRFKKELGELMTMIEAEAAKTEKGERSTSNVQRPTSKEEKTAAPPQSASALNVERSPVPVRFVLLSPIRHEDLRAQRSGLPDPAPHNALLAQYAKAIEELAQERGARFVDLFYGWMQSSPDLAPRDKEATAQAGAAEKLMPNGIHLSEHGYGALGEDMFSLLGWKREIPKDKAVLARWKVNFLALNRSVRAAVLRKNAVFFHRFRPANLTYLTGFRKHEQGQNAREIAEFDALVAAADAEIDRLKRASAKNADAKKGTTENTERTEAKKDAIPNPVSSSAQTSAISAPPVVKTPAPLPDFTVLDGYQIELWAENPHLEKPTQMNWDAQGRLWVASSSTYPQVDPQDVAITMARAAGGTAKAGERSPLSSGDDKILILEDTDRDGRADKSTVFADGLLIPTGVAPDLLADTETRRSGDAEKDSSPASPRPRISASPSPAACYVAQSTELLHLADTDGDGRADQRRVVFSGFGTEDTHHLIHTLRWGPDGRLYFNQSVYIHSHLETPWGMVRLNAGGVFAYDPRTERVEVFCKGLWNTWGHAWDDWGQSFLTDGAGRDGISWAFPGAVFAPSEGARKTMPSVSPGSYPKFCGLEIVKSPHFPADWQGNAVTCDFRAHRVVRFAIDDLAAAAEDAETRRSGDTVNSGVPASSRPRVPASGYVTKEMPDLLRTSDASFRPIDIRLGPDGALYIADWSNPVINHGEVDFRDPRRDKERGRIWRLTKKDTPVVKWVPLVGKDPRGDDLKSRLESGNSWERENARRAFLAVFPMDGEWAEKGLNDRYPIGPERERHWPFEARLLGRFPTGSGTLERLIENGNPRVRLEAMRALPRIPNVRSAELVLAAARNAPKDDPHYEFAAWLSINDLAVPWTDAIASGAWKADTAEREAQLAWGLRAIDPALAGATLARLVADKKIPLDGTGPWFELIGAAGGPAELQPLWDSLLLSFAGNCCETDETRALEGQAAFFDKADTGARAMSAVLEAARNRQLRPAARTHLASVLFHVEHLRAGAIELAGLWKTPDAPEKLPELLGANDLTPALRRTLFRALRAHGSGEARALIENWTAADAPAEGRREAVLTLAAIDFAKAAPLLPGVLAKFPDENAALPYWRDLLAIKGAPDELAKLFATDAWKNVAKPVRATREAGKPAAKLLAALGPVETAPRNYKDYANSARTDGDPARGELIYRRAHLACVTCHAIGGAGGKVGPDMTSLGASAPLDYIIESVLAPAVKVKEGYNAVSVTMLDGLVVSGVQVRETAADLVVRDATGKEQSVPKGQIKAKTDIGSIMPAGLVEQLPHREQLDLFAFLGELGKPGPYDASKGSVARYWQLSNEPPAADGTLHVNAAAISAYTLVDGRLLKEQLAELVPFVSARGEPAVFATTQFQSAGKTRLKLTGVEKAWLDGQPLVLAKGEAAPELASGTHALVMQLEPKQLPPVLRAESPDVRFLGN